MVRDLESPVRPLVGGTGWAWSPRAGTEVWQWCRVYHRGPHNPAGHTPRVFGPLARFDPQRPTQTGSAQLDPGGRSVLYVGVDLATSLFEVFGETQEALLCPRWQVAIVEPSVTLSLLELSEPGAALSIGALPALGDGPVARSLSQEWARAIYEDQPAPSRVTGVRYRSAYYGGIALAVWDSAGMVTTLLSAGGPEDYALSDRALYSRVQTICAGRISVSDIPSDRCQQCRADP